MSCKIPPPYNDYSFAIASKFQVPMSLPYTFGRLTTAGPTVRGLFSQALFSTREGADAVVPDKKKKGVVLIDSEKSHDAILVRTSCLHAVVICYLCVLVSAIQRAVMYS